MMNFRRPKFWKSSRRPRRGEQLHAFEVTVLDESSEFPRDGASLTSAPKKVGCAEQPTACQFCLKPFSNDDIVHNCRNYRHHAFCSGCIKQYVENWMEDETWPELKQQYDGSCALPCLLKDQDDNGGRDVHYLPTRTIRASIDADLMRRFQTKMNLVSSLSNSVDDESNAEATIVESTNSAGKEVSVPHSTKTSSTNRTCQCCFENVVHGQNAVNGYHCTGSSQHMFCIPCVRKYVEEWLYGGAMSASELQSTSDGGWALPCLAPAADHQQQQQQQELHFLPTAAVQQCVSAQVFQHFVEKIETVTTLQQQRKDAPNEEPHASQIFYHQAAEALTEAMMRRCPSCHTQFFKEDESCNKVRCPHCRAMMCYVCRQTLSDEEASDYNHFCRHENNCRKCSRCPLWSIDYEQEDQKRRQSVAADVANRVWENMLLSHADESEAVENEIQRDIERLM